MYNPTVIAKRTILGNGRPIQKSADGAIPTIVYEVCV